MNTENELYVEVIWGQSPDPIFLKMQQHIQIQTLAPLKAIRQDGDKCELEYSVLNLITIETLISTRRFNMRLFTHLLKSLETLNFQLEQYMLSINMLVYSTESLFYDTTTDQFVWVLLPYERPLKAVQREQLHFFRHLLIELEQCSVVAINTLLMATHFSILELQAIYLPLNQTHKISLPQPEKEQTNERLKRIQKIFEIKRKTSNKTKKENTPQKLMENQLSHFQFNLKKTSYVQRHPLLLSRDHPAVQYKVYYETCLIGREHQCEICIDETSISREHAKLYTQSDQYFIEDLNSTNGTFVNNEKISSKIRIQHGDEIRIGHCDFIFLI